MAARRGSRSWQALHDEPIATYSLPSGPKAIERVQWCVRSGNPRTTTVGSTAASVLAS
jgi:hypothetical protein